MEKKEKIQYAGKTKIKTKSFFYNGYKIEMKKTYLDLGSYEYETWVDNDKFGYYKNHKEIKSAIDEAIKENYLFPPRLHEEDSPEALIEKIKTSYKILSDTVGGFTPEQNKTIITMCIENCFEKHGYGIKKLKAMIELNDFNFNIEKENENDF
jgi:hypothetical protein